MNLEKYRPATDEEVRKLKLAATEAALLDAKIRQHEAEIALLQERMKTLRNELRTAMSGLSSIRREVAGSDRDVSGLVVSDESGRFFVHRTPADLPDPRPRMLSNPLQPVDGGNHKVVDVPVEQ